MSEPNFTHNSESADLARSSLQDGTQLPSDGAPAQMQPMNLNPQAYETLLAELAQARSLTQEQAERIRHLEQALDQSLASLKELRLEMVDQALLETQLASTEEIANIQQQAITRLKQQLAQQQQMLDVQLSQTQERDQTVQGLLTNLEGLTQTQQAEVERLRGQIALDRAAVHQYRDRLEKQLSDLQATHQTQQQRIVELESQCLSARVLAATLEVLLEQATIHVQALSQQVQTPALSSLDAIVQQARAALQHAFALESPNLTTASDPMGDRAAHSKISKLEAQIAKQQTAQAMLHHACQELEAVRDCQQMRIAELESQTADMQEQILRQAQQASEYETAVQHWKDCYVNSRSQIQRLRDVLERILPNLPVEIVDLLASLDAAPSAI
ncbi:hypothetical protein H6F43_11360, partial [Leptolyngbya sp. FACHB-36]|uniref:hypothetical protein n=1 Tax=Leptolyngbya sp. FACHB-36 TaxID=2692808 RepID=UPI00168195F5